MNLLNAILIYFDCEINMLRKSWFSNSVQSDMHRYIQEWVFGAQARLNKRDKERTSNDLLGGSSFLLWIHSLLGCSASRTSDMWSWMYKRWLLLQCLSSQDRGIIYKSHLWALKPRSSSSKMQLKKCAGGGPV